MYLVAVKKWCLTHLIKQTNTTYPAATYGLTVVTRSLSQIIIKNFRRKKFERYLCKQRSYNNDKGRNFEGYDALFDN